MGPGPIVTRSAQLVGPVVAVGVMLDVSGGGGGGVLHHFGASASSRGRALAGTIRVIFNAAATAGSGFHT